MDQNRSGNPKFLQPFVDGLHEHALTLSRQPHEDMGPGARALHQVIYPGTIDKFDGAVVVTSELLRKCADGRFYAFRKAPDRKE